MKRLYVDIDGVLLTTKQIKPAENLSLFLDFISSHFDCYWLTTHCRGFENNSIKYLTNHLDINDLEKIKSFKETNWDALKTEGIDLESDFYWLEDYPFQAEILVLKSLNLGDRLIKVELNGDKNLLHVRDLLSKIL
jgi:hypothetical protein